MNNTSTPYPLWQQGLYFARRPFYTPPPYYDFEAWPQTKDNTTMYYEQPGPFTEDHYYKPGPREPFGFNNVPEEDKNKTALTLYSPINYGKYYEAKCPVSPTSEKISREAVLWGSTLPRILATYGVKNVLLTGGLIGGLGALGYGGYKAYQWYKNQNAFKEPEQKMSAGVDKKPSEYSNDNEKERPTNITLKPSDVETKSKINKLVGKQQQNIKQQNVKRRWFNRKPAEDETARKIRRLAGLDLPQHYTLD